MNRFFILSEYDIRNQLETIIVSAFRSSNHPRVFFGRADLITAVNVWGAYCITAPLGEDDLSFPQPINAEPSIPARAQTVNFLENGFFIAKPVVIFSALKIIKHPHALQAFNAQKNELFMPRRAEKFLYVSRCDIWRIFLKST